MRICGCLLGKPIQVCKVYHVTFFTINTVDDKIIVYFCFSCKREWQPCKWLIGTSRYNPYEVSLLFKLNIWRELIQMFSECFLESVKIFLVIWCALPKTRKWNVFWISFCDQSEMDFMPLFEHVWLILCLYLIMCDQLKWVGSNKLL